MTYFIIFPIYIALLLFLIVAAVIARFKADWRAASGYIVGGTIGSLVGFFIANVALILASLLLVRFTNGTSPPEWMKKGLGIIAGVMLFIGPVFASGAGIVGGFAVGLLLVHRRRTKQPGSAAPAPAPVSMTTHDQNPRGSSTSRGEAPTGAGRARLK